MLSTAAEQDFQTAFVVVEPPPAVETAPTTQRVNLRLEKSATTVAAYTGNCSTMTSETLLPVAIDSGNILWSDSSRNDFETCRQSSGPTEVDKLRLELELYREKFANERRRWVGEKQVVVEYQLRLQAYCQQLAERNQLLEERLKLMSLETGRNGGSSGYSSDSAALVQFLDDSNLLTSSL